MKSEKEKRRAALERKAWKQPCPTCGAKPGEGCWSPDRIRVGIHTARIRMASYKPVNHG